MNEKPFFSALLTVSLGVASIAAACGGNTATGPGSKDPNTVSSVETPPPATSSGVTNVPPPGSATADPKVTPPPTPTFEGPMKHPIPTAMTAELTAIGLDVKNLPAIDKLEPKKLRDVMKLFTKSLGVKCGDCHVEGDFEAPTRRKKIAKKMWDEMVRGLTMADGHPVFCDSCHQARVIQLNRGDKRALAKWMDEAFVDKLKRKDNGSHGCESPMCHGPDNDMRFLSAWGK
jgi:hypothetical protein